jgi:tRNA (guanine-N7-)-methyltransferase
LAASGSDNNRNRDGEQQGNGWDFSHNCPILDNAAHDSFRLLGLLRELLLSFLLTVSAREVQSTHCPESFRGSPIIELSSPIEQLDLEKLFGRNAPLHVDLGCGEGSFLCALAQRMPKKNFLGVERLLGRIRSSARKAAGLSNVRLLQMESSYAVRYLLPAEAVETFYLLFPDPWPKRRHHRRRILTLDFLSSVHAALEKNRVIYIATDHLDFFQKIKKIAGSSPGFAIAKVDAELPPSGFELIFRQKGAPIHWLALRKVSPVK